VIFADAAECGVDAVAGVYVEECLSAPVAFSTAALTEVLELTVEPGDYHLVAQVYAAPNDGANRMIASLWEGAAILSEGEFTSSNTDWAGAIPLSAHVSPSDSTTYVLKMGTSNTSARALADPTYFATGVHVTTCLRAYPLGISGPRGEDGPPGIIPRFRFTADCVMEVSLDDGVTYAPMTGWLDNAPNCFAGFDGAGIPVGEVDPGSPPDVQGVGTNQRACDVAAYLAQVVIRGAVNEAQRQAGLTHTALDFGVALLALIPGIDLATLGLVEGANLLYGLVDGGDLADWTAASSDETLWSLVTCAIFGCIVDDGEVTAANFACVSGALGAISYAHAEIPTGLALFWSGLGLHAIRTAQVAGSLEVADCTGCEGSGPWCTWWEADQRDMCAGDMTALTGEAGATPATCSSGAWHAVNNGTGSYDITVEIILPFPRTLDTVRVDYTAGSTDYFNTTMYDEAGGVVHSTALTNWQAGTEGGLQHGVKRVVIGKGTFGVPYDLGSVKIGGPDSGSPWGENNGTCD
jgi:hypothetical protein